MKGKEKRLPVVALIFSIFLFLCAVINLVSGHFGAAVCSLGSGIFFLAISLELYRKYED